MNPQILSNIILKLLVLTLSFCVTLKADDKTPSPKPSWFTKGMILALNIQNSNKIYNELKELVSIYYPEIITTLKGNIGCFHKIFEDATTFTYLLFYNKEQQQEDHIFYITVSDKKLFEQEDIKKYNEKLIIDNTILFAGNVDTLKLYKKFIPENLKIKQENDIELFVDFETNQESFANQEFLAKPLMEQISFLNVVANFTTDFLEISSNLSAKKGSILANFFADSNAKIEIGTPIIPTSDLMSGIFQVELSKFALLLLSLEKKTDNVTQENTKQQKEFLKPLLQFTAPLLLQLNIDKDYKIQSLYLKQNHMKILFPILLNWLSASKDGTPLNTPLFNFFHLFLGSFMSEYQFDLEQKKLEITENDWLHHQLSINKEKTVVASMKEEIALLSPSIDNNLALAKTLNEKKTTSTQTNESLKNYGANHSFYIDFYLHTFLQNEIAEFALPKVQKALKDIVPPIQFVGDLGKNFTSKMKISKTLLSIVLTYILQDEVGIEIQEESIDANDDD